MHGKAAAIAPPFASLGLSIVVPPDLDTDAFGTFSGEVPRTCSMLEAARAKARAAMAATGLPVGLASEGTYGPHPVIPFLAQGYEILLWLDSRTGREIVETLTDPDPCYDQIEAASIAEAERFLSRIGFPATALVVSPACDRTRPIAKGVRDMDQLRQLIDARCNDGPFVLQTDMRAHLNPRRMTMIGQLAQQMADRLARRCTTCSAPGWGFLRRGPALPCAWCGSETLVPGGEIRGCTACGAETPVARQDGRTEADPGSCPLCNP